MKIKNLLPKTFFGRSLAIIIVPVLTLQFVLIYVFYERHWEDVGRRLALALGGQISYIIEDLSDKNKIIKIEEIFSKSERLFLIKSVLLKNKGLKDFEQHQVSTLLDNTLKNSLKERIYLPYKFDTKNVKNTVIIYVEIDQGVIKFTVPRKTLYSSTIEVFMGWMLVTAFLLVIIALHFMHQQIKPLRNITLAAEEFGKGNNNFKLKPRGSYELRLLSNVFIKMRERIKNQIKQRTQMLAGIGHDLKTPLTRMKLQIALLKDKNAIDSLSNDVAEMREMIEAYLIFAKGEGEEEFTKKNLFNFINIILEKNKPKKNILIINNIKKNIFVSIRPLSMQRAILNIYSNALSYAKSKIIISADKRNKNIFLIIEDDGHGIPDNKLLDVFKAFYRVDKSRFSKSGNTGLGLTIAKNIIQGHAGKIKLSKSSMSGLKVEISFSI